MGWEESGGPRDDSLQESRFAYPSWAGRHSKFEGHECLALLRLPRGKCGVEFSDKCASLEECLKGDSVSVVSSPFGMLSPHIFLNNIIRGTVSNIINNYNIPSPSSPVLFLLDAECHPGSEGSAIFGEDGKITGVLLPPLHKAEGYSTKLHVFASWRFVVGHVGAFFSSNPNSSQDRVERKHTKHSPSAVARKSLVLVSVGGSWGSGVIIDAKGYILTNAHLVLPFASLPTQKQKEEGSFSPKMQVPVRVRLDYPTPLSWYEAEVVYASSSHVDVALLHITSKDLPALKSVLLPSPSAPKVSQRVFAAGHGIFGPSTRTLPTLTSGILSKIVSHNSQEVIYLSSAAIHAGNSGGALLDAQGAFLGLLTCNVTQSGGKVIPKINMSIPYSLLQPLFLYSSNPAPNLLDKMEREDEQVRKLWKLESDFSDVKHEKRSTFERFADKFKSNSKL